MSPQETDEIFEVRLSVDSKDIGIIEILKGMLMESGIAQSEIVECFDWPDTCLSIYHASKVRAYSLKKKIRSYNLNKVVVIVKRLLKKDWKTKWKKDYKPFILTKSFGVIPTYMRGKYCFKDRVPLYIDTDLAFGTGLHATTRFMAQFVEEYKGQYKSFLDVGTGTGILSMIAEKCDAKIIDAVDISPDAVKVAQDNFLKNDCDSANVKLVDGKKLKTKRKYDFVCANIITQDLIEMAEELISYVKVGKYLAVSGISLKSYEVFRESYAAYPLRCLKIEKGEGWTAILFKKLPPN